MAYDSQSELVTENAALKQEVNRLKVHIAEAAGCLRQELTMRALNETVRSLNRGLPEENKITEFSWGTTTPEALRQAVRELGYLVGMYWEGQPIILAEREEDGLR